MTAFLVALCMGFIAWFLPVFALAPITQFESFVPDFTEVFSPKMAVILFGGDMMFDRSVREATEIHGQDFLFSCLRDTLASVDLVVANLEGPITPYPSISVGSIIGSGDNFTFTFPTTTATLLKRHNISVVNVGNNHILNFGDEGVHQTKRWLEEAGVQYFGDPHGSEHDRVARREVNGILFSFISWSDWTGGKRDAVLAQIALERSWGRLPIVYTHWGEEYVSPSERVQNLAHSFIDAGAEIVIGSHPHVVLEHEEYQGKYIYYSLGNLIFDQYFNEQVRSGLMLRIAFTEKGVSSITPIPTYLERDRRTCLKEVE